jgi:lysine 6-dehydrogenase
MNFLLLGSGMQGRAIAWDLLHRNQDTNSLVIVDRQAPALADLAAWLDDPRVRTVQADVTDAAAMAPLFQDSDVSISAVNYWFNADLTRLAIAGGSHFLDLGGNNDIVAAQFAQNDAAVAAGVTIIPDCGLAPGLAGLLGYHLADGFTECRSLKLRVGGLPLRPQPPLNYMIVFAVQGLINEYIEPCVVIRDGVVGTVPGMSEVEALDFPEPFGRLEAFQTSGGCSTLPQTLLGKVRDMDYKTIRYPGHRDQIQLLMDLGLTASDPLTIGDAKVRPRDVLGPCLEAVCPQTGPDVILLRLEATGLIDGKETKRSLQIIDHQDTETSLTAMTRMTGFPAAIIAAMLAGGRIEAGAKPQELVIPGEAMIAELRRRGIDVVLDQA